MWMTVHRRRIGWENVIVAIRATELAQNIGLMEAWVRLGIKLNEPWVWQVEIRPLEKNRWLSSLILFCFVFAWTLSLFCFSLPFMGVMWSFYSSDTLGYVGSNFCDCVLYVVLETKSEWTAEHSTDSISLTCKGGKLNLCMKFVPKSNIRFIVCRRR